MCPNEDSKQPLQLPRRIQGSVIDGRIEERRACPAAGVSEDEGDACRDERTGRDTEKGKPAGRLTSLLA